MDSAPTIVKLLVIVIMASIAVGYGYIGTTRKKDEDARTTRKRKVTLQHVIIGVAISISIYMGKSIIDADSARTQQIARTAKIGEIMGQIPRAAYPTGFHKYSGHAQLFFPCEEKVVADYCQRLDDRIASRLAETDAASKTTSTRAIATRAVALEQAGAYTLCTEGQAPVAVVPSDSGLFPSDENDSDLLQMIQSNILVAVYRRHIDPQEFSVECWWKLRGSPDVVFELPYSGESLMYRASKGIEMRRAVQTRDVGLNTLHSESKDEALSQIIKSQVFILVWPEPQLRSSSEELFKYLQNTPLLREVHLTINNKHFSFDLNQAERHRDTNGFLSYETTFPEPGSSNGRTTEAQQ